MQLRFEEMKRHLSQMFLDKLLTRACGAQDSSSQSLKSLGLIISKLARVENFDRKTGKLGSHALKMKCCENKAVSSRTTSIAEIQSLSYNGCSKSCFSSRHPKLRFSTYQSQASELGGIIEVPLAQTGEGIADCELLSWFVKEGDEVNEFQPLCSVQSDKASMQITSRYTGKVSRLNFIPGDVVKVGETLLELITGSSKSMDAIHACLSEELSGAKEDNSLLTQDASCDHEEVSRKRVLATPAVRHLAQEYGINLEDVSGSGKDGRILKEDLMSRIANREGLNEEMATISEIAPKRELVSQKTESKISQHMNLKEPGVVAGEKMENRLLEDKVIPVRGYQRIMVKTMTAAAAIPHFHLVDELKVDALVSLKKNLKDVFVEQGVKSTYLPFIIKALSVALYKYPLVNSTCNEDGSEICRRGAHNVGVAIATSQGLAVPNIKNVQSLSVLEIAKELSRLTQSATANQLSSADVSDGTITVSNFGSVGGKFGSPLLNVPEVAIVAIGRIQKLPRFSEDESIYPVSIMNVTWGADHRVLDGATVANVCNEFKTLVEQPERLLMHLR